MKVKYVSRFLYFWTGIIILSFSLLYNYTNSNSNYFNVGPNNNLKILNVLIDTYSKYFGIIFYCFFNSIIRTVNSKVLSSWLINYVQNFEKKTDEVIKLSYEITTISSMYGWIDWFIYMNLLLGQIDFMLIEIFADIITGNITTFLYIKKSSTNTSEETNEEQNNDIVIDIDNTELNSLI